jgi:hypothetical protein
MEPFYVLDDVLPNPDAYRAAVLALSFGDVTIGDDTFRGIAPAHSPDLPIAFERAVPEPIETVLSFFRRSPLGQPEPTYLHSDAAMGDWTGILYLNPRPPDGDGTVFWERLSTGHRYGPWDTEVERASKDLALWVPWHVVAARFNRLVIFRSDLFHSRALPGNYGQGVDARLVQVVFGRRRPEVRD